MAEKKRKLKPLRQIKNPMRYQKKNAKAWYNALPKGGNLKEALQSLVKQGVLDQEDLENFTADFKAEQYKA